MLQKIEASGQTGVMGRGITACAPFKGCGGDDISEQFDKDNRIQAELDRISVFFEELPENKKSIVSPLIQNASFMLITLADLQEIISREGPVEAYQNGANQHGLKQSAALQSYNALVKNYAAVIKSLFGMLPYQPKEIPKLSWEKTESDELQEAKSRADDEHTMRIQAELKLVAERQRFQREMEKLKNEH